MLVRIHLYTAGGANTGHGLESCGLGSNFGPRLSYVRLFGTHVFVGFCPFSEYFAAVSLAFTPT